MSLSANKNLNIVCAVVHACLAALWVYRKNKNFKVPATYGIYQNALVSNGFGGLKVVAREQKDSRFQTDTRDLMIQFFTVTSIFHIIYAAGSAPDGYYTQMLQRGNNMLRWVEYSITSTLMINVISRLSGVNNSGILSLMTASNVCIMIQGQSTEVVLADSSLSVGEKIKRILVPQVTAWILLFTIWGIIIRKFYQILDDVETGVNKGRPPGEKIKIPDAVRIAVWSQFLFFSVFGLVQMTQIISNIRGGDTTKDYVKYEIAYNSLSLASKATLGLVLAYGIEQTSGRDENTVDAELEVDVTA